MENINKQAMELAIKESTYNLENNYQQGGPFGAVIVKDNKIIVSAHNTVIENKDATAHAEINAIRKASQKLNTHDLSGCILFTSCEPCPMCLSAIIWANIKEVYYCNTKDDANNIGFKDDIIYDYLKGENKDLIKLKKMDLKDAKDVFNKFKNINNKKMY